MARLSPSSLALRWTLAGGLALSGLVLSSTACDSDSKSKKSDDDRRDRDDDDDDRRDRDDDDDDRRDRDDDDDRREVIEKVDLLVDVPGREVFVHPPSKGSIPFDEMESIPFDEIIRLEYRE